MMVSCSLMTKDEGMISFLKWFKGDDDAGVMI